MAKKNEMSTKIASAIMKDFQEILTKYGLDTHTITKFNIAPIDSLGMTESITKGSDKARREEVCEYVNGKLRCRTI